MSLLPWQDRGAPRDGGRAPAPVRLRTDVVAVVIFSCLVLLLVVMLARVGQLQSIPSVRLAAHISDRVSNDPEPGVRGEILDRRSRLLAGSRFGYRVFVDPTAFPVPPDDALAKLADAVGLPTETVAARIVPKIAENERRSAAITAAKQAPADSPEAKAPALVRYISVGGVLDDWRVNAVKAAHIPGVHLELRSVRESPGSDLLASFLGKVGIEDKGLTGAEMFLNDAVKPAPGSLSYVRDAYNRPLWIEQGAYVPPKRGRDVRLALDIEIQRIAGEELRKGVEAADAAGGRCVIVDPLSGEVVAMVDIVRNVPGTVPFDWDNPYATGRRYITIRQDDKKQDHPELARNRCVEDVYEPGSTFKPFMWAATTQLGLADPSEVVDTGGGHWSTAYGRHIEDVVKRDQQTWAEVLINSSNIGMAKITRRMTDAQMYEAVRRFGFGTRVFPTKPGPGEMRGLPGESPGIVTLLKAWTKYTQASVAMGHEIAVTPVQMARAYIAFARTGDLAGTIPPVRLTALDTESPQARQPTRVLPAAIANLTRETMRGVTHNLELRMARSKDEPPPRYDLFGKSGTAEIPIGKPPKGKKKPKGFKGYYPGQYNSSFVAAGPSDAPRLICIVVIDDPGPERVRARTHYGSSVAGPVVRHIMERSLAYLGVPPSYTADNPPPSLADAANADDPANKPTMPPVTKPAAAAPRAVAQAQSSGPSPAKPKPTTSPMRTVAVTGTRR